MSRRRTSFGDLVDWEITPSDTQSKGTVPFHSAEMRVNRARQSVASTSTPGFSSKPCIRRGLCRKYGKACANAAGVGFVVAFAAIHHQSTWTFVTMERGEYRNWMTITIDRRLVYALVVRFAGVDFCIVLQSSCWSRSGMCGISSWLSTLVGRASQVTNCIVVPRFWIGERR